MDNIKQLLELNIEIEGLLRVAEYRKSDNVESLLLAKTKKFTELLNASITENSLHIEAPAAMQSVPVPQAAMSIVKDIFPVMPALKTASNLQDTENSEDIRNTTVSSPDLISEEIETVLEMDESNQEFQEYPPAGDPAPPVFNHDTPQNTNDEVVDENNQIDLSSPKDFSSESHHVMRLDEMIHRQSSRDLKKAFSLNDRFRYIRELFDNDAKYFDETINNLDMLSNLDDVYDYLLGDIGLNHEDETVKDFLAIIYNHFNI